MTELFERRWDSLKKEVTDHLGRNVQYQYPPQRIVSCPCITETLYALSLEKIAGRTKYCLYPADKTKGQPLSAVQRLIKWRWRLNRI